MAAVYPGGAAIESLEAQAPVAGRACEHVHYLHNLRAVAVMLVIGSHCFGLAWSRSAVDWSEHDPVLSFVKGATPLFLFISGYFFHHVFARDFRYARFLRKKAGMLLPPYLVMTALLLLAEHAMGVDSMRYRVRDPGEQLVMAMLTGGAGPAMWYIPFIFDIFLLSPLFLLFARMENRLQRVVLGLLFVLGMAVDRGDAFTRFANLANLSFYYALGIHCSIDRAGFEALVRRPGTMAVCAGTIAVLAAVQYRLGLDLAAGHAVAWSPAKIIYVRKIAQILLLAGLLLRFADRRVPGLDLVARWSFGIYFLHQLPLVLLMPFAAQGWIPAGYGALVFYSGLVLLIALALAWTGRRLFGSNSRYLIGV